jgi:O-antigen ligase
MQQKTLGRFRLDNPELRSAGAGSASPAALPASRFGKFPKMGAVATNLRLPDGGATRELHWTFAFLAVLFYAFMEYSRLPEMYTVLQPLQLGKISVALLGIGYLASSKSRRATKPVSHTIDVAMIVFILANFVASCLANFQNKVWDNMLDVAFWGVVYFALTRILSNTWQIRILLLLILLLNLKFAQHTIRSYHSARSEGQSDMAIIMTGGAGAGGASFFGNVADLGLALCVVWGIVWAWLVGKAENKKLVRIFLIVCFVLYFLAILFCGSRGAVVGAGAIALVALAKSRRKFMAILLVLIVGLGVWLILPQASKIRFQHAWAGDDANANSRIAFWEIGMDMWKHNPVFGIGPGIFAFENPFHMVSHSVYIQVLAESGLVGTLSWTVMLLLFFKVNWRTRKRMLASGPEGRRSLEYCLALGLDLGMVGYLSSGAFLAVLYYPHFWILLSLSVALGKSAMLAYPDAQPAAAPWARSFAPTTR